MTVSISHTQYIDTLLKRFNLKDCIPVSTPMEPGLYLSKHNCPHTPEEIESMHNVPVWQLVSSLLWTSQTCFPQITHAVHQVTQFNSNPGCVHWETVKQILQYLKGQHRTILVSGGDGRDPTALMAYSTLNWAKNCDDPRSTSGYVIKLGELTVSWSLKKQNTVAASSTDVEYMAAAYCSRHILWDRNLLTELAVEQIDQTKESQNHQCTKYINVAHHFVCKRVEDKSLEVYYVPSKEQLADGFTKPVLCVDFKLMVDWLVLE